MLHRGILQVGPGSGTQVPALQTKSSPKSTLKSEGHMESEYIYVLFEVFFPSPFFCLLIFNAMSALFHLILIITSYNFSFHFCQSLHVSFPVCYSFFQHIYTQAEKAQPDEYLLTQIYNFQSRKN